MIVQSPQDDGAARALAGAALLLDSPTASAYTRTVARLLRHAVESAVDAYWQRHRPGEIVATSGRGRQIRLLAATVSSAAAHDVYATWCQLSDATRPHPYELAPTVAEMRTLQHRARRAVEVVGQ